MTTSMLITFKAWTQQYFENLSMSSSSNWYDSFWNMSSRFPCIFDFLWHLLKQFFELTFDENDSVVWLYYSSKKKLLILIFPRNKYSTVCYKFLNDNHFFSWTKWSQIHAQYIQILGTILFWKYYIVLVVEFYDFFWNMSDRLLNIFKFS